MNLYNRFTSYFITAAFVVFAGAAENAFGAAVEPVLSLAKKEKPALLETLKQLVSIETGSRDREGLDRLADLRTLCWHRLNMRQIF